jgi:hypothetical protein
VRPPRNGYIVGRTDATMLDSEMIAAWLTAPRELSVEVVAPRTLVLPGGGTVEVEAFLPDFGGPNGTAVVALQDDRRCKLAANTRHFTSQLADGYRAFERSRFQETLDDWGWYGPAARRPAWYSGKSWS